MGQAGSGFWRQAGFGRSTVAATGGPTRGWAPSVLLPSARAVCPTAISPDTPLLRPPAQQSLLLVAASGLLSSERADSTRLTAAASLYLRVMRQSDAQRLEQAWQVGRHGPCRTVSSVAYIRAGAGRGAARQPARGHGRRSRGDPSGAADCWYAAITPAYRSGLCAATLARERGRREAAAAGPAGWLRLALTVGSVDPQEPNIRSISAACSRPTSALATPAGACRPTFLSSPVFWLPPSPMFAPSCACRIADASPCISGASPLQRPASGRDSDGGLTAPSGDGPRW